MQHQARGWKSLKFRFLGGKAAAWRAAPRLVVLKPGLLFVAGSTSSSSTCTVHIGGGVLVLGAECIGLDSVQASASSICGLSSSSSSPAFPPSPPQSASRPYAFEPQFSGWVPRLHNRFNPRLSGVNDPGRSGWSGRGLEEGSQILQKLASVLRFFPPHLGTHNT